MYFINLEKIKIVKAYNYEVHGIFVSHDLINKSIGEMQKEIAAAMEANVKNFKPAIECCYEMVISDADETATEEETAQFLSVVNLASTNFLKAICKEEGRKREHRLGLPDKLAAVKTSIISIKNAINHETIIDNFNLMIRYKDLTYWMCDEKELQENDN